VARINTFQPTRHGGRSFRADGRWLQKARPWPPAKKVGLAGSICPKACWRPRAFGWPPKTGALPSTQVLTSGGNRPGHGCGKTLSPRRSGRRRRHHSPALDRHTGVPQPWTAPLDRKLREGGPGPGQDRSASSAKQRDPRSKHQLWYLGLQALTAFDRWRPGDLLSPRAADQLTLPEAALNRPGLAARRCIRRFVERRNPAPYKRAGHWVLAGGIAPWRGSSSASEADEAEGPTRSGSNRLWPKLLEPQVSPYFNQLGARSYPMCFKLLSSWEVGGDLDETEGSLHRHCKRRGQRFDQQLVARRIPGNGALVHRRKRGHRPGCVPVVGGKGLQQKPGSNRATSGAGDHRAPNLSRLSSISRPQGGDAARKRLGGDGNKKGGCFRLGLLAQELPGLIATEARRFDDGHGPARLLSRGGAVSLLAAGWGFGQR